VLLGRDKIARPCITILVYEFQTGNMGLWRKSGPVPGVPDVIFLTFTKKPVKVAHPQVSIERP